MTKLEREKKILELRKLHQPYFDSIGEPDALFVPSMAYMPRALTETHMSFFSSALNKGRTVYTEKVNKHSESEDDNRTLYSFPYNEFFEEEYPSEEKESGNGAYKIYFFPISEMEIIDKSTVPETIELMDPDTDAPVSQLTARDLIAIVKNKPISNNKWINDLITRH